MIEKWLKQRNPPVPIDVYCPVNLETGQIVVGLSYVGEPDGEVVGEFWYEKGEIKAELYQGCKENTKEAS